MSKWFGKIGFAEPYEVNGVVKDHIVEREYYGEVTRNNRRYQDTSKINDDLTISNQISIVADPYALNSFYSMKYVEFCGSLWKVNSVEVQFPRLVLEVGGVYNGEQATA